MKTKEPTVLRGIRSTIFPINLELVSYEDDLVAEM
jgi:hypothetical protein